MEGNIQEIIACLDKYLSESGNEEIGAVEANAVLERAGLLPDRLDRPGAPLRILLRDGKVPHAYQQGNRWKIPHSKKILLEEKKSSRTKYSKTPSASNKNMKVYPRLESCDAQVHVKSETRANGGKKYVLIIIIALIFVIGYYNSEDSSGLRAYYVVNDVYAATSKEAYDNYNLSCESKDIAAVGSMLFSGDLEILTKGTDVFLVKSGFSYVVVRKEGQHRSLWVAMGDVKKK